MKRALCLIAALIACREDDTATTQTPIENLDAHAGPADADAELEMIAGRLNKVPLSSAWYGQFTYTTGVVPIGHTVHVRAGCSISTAPQDECDPGILVAVFDSAGALLNVRYDNDSATAGGNGFGGHVGFTQGSNTTRIYRVIAYSHFRGTSRVDVEWDTASLAAGPDWDNTRGFVDPLDTASGISRSGVRVGGALVRLGPVASIGETFSVRTADDGVGAQSGSRIWLFNLSRRAFAFDDGATTGDRDPRFTFTNAWTCNSACTPDQPSTTFAIVAKDRASSTAPELWVDLVKTIGTEVLRSFPFSTCIGSTSRPDCLGGPDLSLAPGDYFFSVFGNATSFPVGRVPALDGEDHPADDTGDDGKCGGTPRGQGNDLAFTVQLFEDGRIVQQRHVPRGALGSEYTLAGDVLWNRISLSHSVPDDGQVHRYRLDIRDVGLSIVVRNQWAHRRNPEDVQLKVATLNLEYSGDGLQPLAEVQNAADLLGAGPSYGLTTVTYKNNRGKWRWEADIINFNEILGGRGLQMEDRLNDRTALDWARSEGESIWPDNIIGAGTTRYGPILINHLARRSGGDPSFGTILDDLTDCNSEFNHCELTETIRGHYYTIPARGAARRLKGSTGGFHERPIGIFHAYMPSRDSDVGPRDTASSELVDHMENLLRRDPASFNDSANDDPKDLGNRMIIMGDLNMANAQCAEGNSLLRKLRERFGYAVDVTMAVTDPNDRTFDMHYSGAPITDFRTGTYGDCLSSTWTDPGWNQGTSNGCPFHYENAGEWFNDSDKFTTGLSQFHAWWAGSSSGGGGGGSRLDVIILAGLGWADDDPVLEYAAISNNDVPTVMNGGEGIGVEIRHWCSDPQVIPLGDDRDYHPENGTCEQPPEPGRLAFRSDHKPVGARLRLQWHR